jgi:hypothetical protein
LELSKNDPFYLVITGKIITSPFPESPITLRAFHNAFQSLPNRSIGDIYWVSPNDAANPKKCMKISPRGWPNLQCLDLDFRKMFHHFTIRPNEKYSVRHEVSRANIEECGPKIGERYRVRMNDKALGTFFWCWCDLEDMEGLKFGDGPYTREYFEENGRDDWDEEYANNDLWVNSEEPKKLALVIEKAEAEFDIV